MYNAVRLTDRVKQRTLHKGIYKILLTKIDLPIIVDAGISRPSQACEAMETGAAAVMANTAIAIAGDVPKMAQAFKKAIEAGRESYLAGFGDVVEKGARASSPLTGFYTINFERFTKMKERTNHMEYMEGMEVIDSTLLDEVISAMDAYDYDKYTDKDVENALSHDVLSTKTSRHFFHRRHLTTLKKWHKERKLKQESISEIPFRCLHLCT